MIFDEIALGLRLRNIDEDEIGEKKTIKKKAVKKKVIPDEGRDWTTAEEKEQVPSVIASTPDTSIDRVAVHETEYFDRNDAIDVTETNPVLTGTNDDEVVEELVDVPEENDDGEWSTSDYNAWSENATFGELRDEVIRIGQDPGRLRAPGLRKMLKR